MRRLLIFALALAALFAPAATARPAGDADATRAALLEIQAELVDAAAASAAGDPTQARSIVVDALVRLSAFDLAPNAPRRALRRTVSRLRRASDLLASAAPADDAEPVALRLRSASTALRDALAHTVNAASGCTLSEVAAPRAGFHRPGYRALFRVRPASGATLPALTVENDDPARTAVVASATALRGGRFRVVFGEDAGAATLTATCGASQATLRVFCLGHEGALGEAPPTAPDYGATPLFARVGAAFGPATPATTVSGSFVYEVAPELPAGLLLDRATGAISGTPSVSGPAASFRVTRRNARSEASVDVLLDVDPALPPRVEELEGGFAIEALAEDSAIPVKMTSAPGGELFFSELTTGNVRVIDSAGALQETPVLSLPVLLGPEQGLFGIAAAPDYATSGNLYLVASAPAEGAHANRNRLLRTRVTAGVGSAPEVLVDDLPLGNTQNGGHLLFGTDGALYLSTGDLGDSALAQSDGSLAGRILRIAPDGSVPSDNPIAGSYEWCRGFRNPFGLAVNPVSGYVFATENGPAADDELDFVQPGKNFEWGAAEGEFFGALTGIRVTNWTPVIVPTGIACHDGQQFGSAYADNIFLGSYDLAQVRRLVMEGVDLRAESVFVQFDEVGFAQKPLDVVRAVDGSLLVSTFATVWRIRRD